MADSRMRHVSTEIVRLPLAGVDPEIDEVVIRGYYKDLKVVALKNGERIRIGRTKGTTYRKPKE